MCTDRVETATAQVTRRMALRRFFFKAHRASAPDDIEEEASQSGYVDDRLREEPKLARHRIDQRRSCPSLVLRICTCAVACYVLGVQDPILSFFTSVRCTPLRVSAGSNVTCVIETAPYSTDANLAIVPLGMAGPISLVDDGSSHRYRVTFSTAATGSAGVTVTHQVWSSSAGVEVVAAPCAVMDHRCYVDVACEPRRATVGTEVRCEVTPRDRFGNVAEIEPAAGVATGRFSVSRSRAAGELTVHDTFVSFVPQEAGLAGVVVTLDGVRTSSDVEVVE